MVRSALVPTPTWFPKNPLAWPNPTQAAGPAPCDLTRRTIAPVDLDLDYAAGGAKALTNELRSRFPLMTSHPEGLNRMMAAGALARCGALVEGICLL